MKARLTYSDALCGCWTTKPGLLSSIATLTRSPTRMSTPRRRPGELGLIRGAVYRIDLGSPRGHEQRGRRLGLIISPSESPLSMVTVVPTSTSAGASVHRPLLEIAGAETRLLVDQIRSIDTNYVVGDPVDYLNLDAMGEVEVAIGHYLGILAGSGSSL